MKVKVDFDRCQSNGLCEAIAPATFELDDDDYLQILDDEVTEQNREAIERAVASCPTSAISIVED
ncbi:ferredoxin [Nocardioides donggukensis]|uniref:Ferredoxin n=1 Tax=Nocardioides donggukensis TaxID=2774019 RepID=A0A927Q1M1_9ACTN|nr:ferredoxin [Nocardioides donggukensis]MBD8869579.1 ferredoxin [Nocardioides donggukensis]